MRNVVQSNRAPTSASVTKCVAVQGPSARSQQTVGPRASRASEALKLVAVTASLASLALSASASDAVEPVYFGNGCYWGRQYDFVKTEQTKLGRTEKDISAVVGYAGGRKVSPSGKVCYYYTNELDTIYEKLGHAEVVQVELRDDGSQMTKEDQFRMYAKTYFSEFNKLRSGKMQRQDPQDMGAGMFGRLPPKGHIPQGMWPPRSISPTHSQTHSPTSSYSSFLDRIPQHDWHSGRRQVRPVQNFTGGEREQHGPQGGRR